MILGTEKPTIGCPHLIRASCSFNLWKKMERQVGVCGREEVAGLWPQLSHSHRTAPVHQGGLHPAPPTRPHLPPDPTSQYCHIEALSFQHIKFWGTLKPQHMASPRELDSAPDLMILTPASICPALCLCQACRQVCHLLS